MNAKKKRNVILVSVVLVVIIAIAIGVKLYLDKDSKNDLKSISKELTEKTTLLCEGLNDKDIEALKALYVEKYVGNIDANYILNLLSEQDELDKTDISVDDFYCTVKEILNKEFEEQSDDSFSQMEEINEYEMKVLVEFGIKGQKSYSQKWKIIFNKENNEYKISDIGLITNTLSEIQ